MFISYLFPILSRSTTSRRFDLQSLSGEVAKSKSYFRLSSSSFPGETRGEVDLQMNILPLKDAEKNPVGAARDKPNDDPFLPEPVRKVRSFFNSNFMYYVKIVFFVGILAGVIFFTVVGTNVNNQKQA